MSASGEFESELNNSSTSNSFWEVKQYGRCIRRLENGNKLCSDICNMIQDRVEIEKNYSNSLHKWSSKWTAYLDSGAEYGTTKACWLGWCNEAEALSDIHKALRTTLIEDIQTEVRNWQKEHHHKATLPPQHLKESKSLESEFETAQRPWAKKLKKANQSKRDYHQQCKTLRSFEIQNKNSSNESNASAEQIKKMEEKIKKTEIEVEKFKNIYDAALRDLSGDCARYTDEMTKVFNKSQSMERDRMTFFKSIFLRIQKTLNLSENNNLRDIYSNFEKVIDSLDSDMDVKQWSQSYGSDMQFICPQFEEYISESTCILRKKPTVNSETGATLSSVNSSSRQASIRSTDNGSQCAMRTSTGTESPISSPNTDAVGVSKSECSVDEQTPPSKPRRLTITSKLSLSDQTPSVDNADVIKNESPVFSDQCGTQVRALYDYNGAEEDELTLIQGEIFTKLEDEDEQGWCKGKKDGRVGLYPANYAETV